ncbi:GNAT family N-acetyltransferase [Occultella aeris]|uniref:Succinyl-CoA transferase n=1 Tax=Occultella aeris TaxID=2761496 RepID=A0A7M4DNS5_9MICO|nr:GNAT family protein [Occultella aeris]VZO39106.1 Putative succinyl-CoA transferase [Occultella aeris]
MSEHAEPHRVPSDVDLSPAAQWPLLGLSARTGNLELRYIDDELMFDVAAVAARGVHAEDFMPFDFPWTRGTPLEVARSVLAYEWGKRAAISPDAWTIELAVLVDGVPAGIQAIDAKSFAVARTVETGSWLGRAFQGRGLGTRMRALMLHLAFAGLGAEVATTSAWADNGPSNGVTRKLGYSPNGVWLESREGKPIEKLHYRLARADWEANPAARIPDVTLTGTEPVREFLRIS